jgi:nucleotide-binding universal stress UspA family protein
MGVFARIVVGVDGTDWGFEALRQALVLAPKENPVLLAVTALDTAPAVRTGFHAAHFAELLANEAEETRDAAEAMIAGREGCEARFVRGKPVDVLRRERDELQATLMALGGRRSSRFLGIMLGDTGTELVHDAACSALLACPADDRPWQPRRIVVGFDGSTYALAALRTAEELARAFSGAVEVVAATGGKPVERDAAWSERVDLGSSTPGRDPRRALARRRPGRRRVARRPRPPRARQRQRARRAPSSLHGPPRARAADEKQRLTSELVGAPPMRR